MDASNELDDLKEQIVELVALTKSLTGDASLHVRQVARSVKHDADEIGKCTAKISAATMIRMFNDLKLDYSEKLGNQGQQIIEQQKQIDKLTERLNAASKQFAELQRSVLTNQDSAVDSK